MVKMGPPYILLHYLNEKKEIKKKVRIGRFIIHPMSVTGFSLTFLST